MVGFGIVMSGMSDNRTVSASRAAALLQTVTWRRQIANKRLAPLKLR
jgi:hypothetical protein